MKTSKLDGITIFHNLPSHRKLILAIKIIIVIQQKVIILIKLFLRNTEVMMFGAISCVKKLVSGDYLHKERLIKNTNLNL